MSTWHIRWASQAVLNGGVIAYPTEAVFGLGCSPWNGTAVSRILSIKRRSLDKGLIVVAAHINQLESLVDFNETVCTESVFASWPGPLTWVLPAKRQVPKWLTGKHSGIAVRVTAHPLVRDLCESVGLLVSTSANPVIHRPATTAFQVRAYFANRIDYIVPGNVGLDSKPTEIRHGLTGKVIRKGID